MSLKTLRAESLVAAVALAVLLGLAVWGRSAVMAVSVAGMALAFSATRASSLKRRLATVAAAGVGAALAAEAVHTVYHLVEPGPAGDSGGFFVSALVVGVIDALAFGAVLLGLHVLKARGGRLQEPGGAASQVPED